MITPHNCRPTDVPDFHEPADKGGQGVMTVVAIGHLLAVLCAVIAAVLWWVLP